MARTFLLNKWAERKHKIILKKEERNLSILNKNQKSIDTRGNGLATLLLLHLIIESNILLLYTLGSLMHLGLMRLL